MWRYVVYRIDTVPCCAESTCTDRQRIRVVVALGEIDRDTDAGHIVGYYAPDAMPHNHGAASRVWDSKAFRYGASVLREDTNGYADLANVKLGSRLEDVWGDG